MSGFEEELAKRNAELRDEVAQWERSDAALQQAHHEMKVQVEQRTEDLLRSNAELEEFAYVASHDLQAPLRAIDKLSAWVMEDLGDLLEGETRENMELLRKRVSRMKRLLDDLLCYSRAGRVEAKVERVDVGELVTEIANSIDLPAGFQVVAVDGLPVFETGRSSLTQVLQNLVGNAIKHHDRSEGRVEVSALDMGNHYEFTVADDGPGIPPELQEKAFAMFQTLRSRDEIEGSGIGLAVVKKMVEKQGGGLWLESDADRQGSVFHFEWRKLSKEVTANAGGRDR